MHAFFSCWNLKEVVWPRELVAIGSYAFAATGMVTVRLPDKLERIGDTAFGYSSALRYVIVPPEVTMSRYSLDSSNNAIVVTQPGTKVAEWAEKNKIPFCFAMPKLTKAPSSETLPSHVRRTCYELLNPEEKVAYAALMKAFLKMEDRCDFSGILIENVNWGKLRKAMEADLPEIFWVNWRLWWNSSLAGGNLAEVYTITKEQRDQMQQQIDALANPFIKSIPQSFGDYKKAKMVFDWLANQLEYDHAGLKAQREKKYVSVTNDDLRNIYGAFVKKKVVCVGYAQAFSYILHAIGLECVMRLSIDHAWACAKLEGDYYHIDVTWGDEEVRELEYHYFGMTDDEVYKYQTGFRELAEHIVCNSTRCSYYAKEGLYLDQVDEAELLEIVQRHFPRKGKCLRIKFADMYLLEQAYKCLNCSNRLLAIARERGFARLRVVEETRHNMLRIEV